jgi:nucleotide-binding universal stress UspA family protein
LGASVLAVHAVEAPVYPWLPESLVPPLYADVDREKIREELRDQWCKQLQDADVSFAAEVIDGYPANVIIETAQREKADLVVVGRRGLGGFAKLVLGSTTRRLSSHLDRPLVIVP